MAAALCRSTVTTLDPRKRLAPKQGRKVDPQSLLQDSQGSGGDDRQPHQRWQGRSTQFMQSNQHSRDREGRWSTEGLQGPALAIVEGDRDGAR